MVWGRSLLCVLGVIGLWIGLGDVASAQTTNGGTLRAAAGRVDITPTKPVFMAGYNFNRKSVDAHDPLMARCLVLETGGTRIAIVSCDVLGVPRYRADAIRAQVKAVTPDHLYIAATHTHSGPDTMGEWGPAITVSGVDTVWMQGFLQKVTHLVEETAAHLEPVTLKFAATTEVPRISKNIRVPSILDKELGVMQVIAKGSGMPLATLVNYACHPEILNTHHLTADFPCWLYKTVEGRGGGVCLYLNGAQGGMVTADYDESTAPKFENWMAAETIGTSMGERVLEIIKDGESVPEATISTQQRIFTAPLENQNFKTLARLHVFPGEILKEGNIETEVNRIRIGPAEFLTFPGEVLPNIGLALKQEMSGKYKFQLGLTCDELGYILTPEDFDNRKLYSYEDSQSVGRQMEPLMVKYLHEMMQQREK
ncbi:MAG TPA: hypothetical protein VKU00_32870 [Chthonomonadaceae bacterium]|nr:hypothetical protein [Chthonomonadaceae bacterium]